MVLTIVLGLIGLGIVIFVHESGHFLAAKLFHIEVESFALGWGKKIIGFTHGITEYRLNIFPIGGYCRMRGEQEFKRAIENKLSEFPYSEGSLFSVSPMKRFLTYAAGPLFNILFAIVLFSGVWLIGYDYQTFSNKIIIANDYPGIYGEADHLSPAERAGLSTGDSIISIAHKPIQNFSDIQEALIGSPGKSIEIEFLHNGEVRSSTITPELNKNTGAGVIGISAWIDPIIDYIPQDSLLVTSGLQHGDRIIAINDQPIAHILDLYMYLSDYTGVSYTVDILRNNSRLSMVLPVEHTEDGKPIFNAGFQTVLVHTPDYNLFQSFYHGAVEAFSTFGLAFHSLALIFKGLNMSEAMAGPVKITYLVGNTAAKGFSQGLKTGVITIMQLLAFISVALGFANLLPIPALDGGQMIVSIAEGITHKSVSPQNYYRLQIIGFGILFSIMIFTLLNDITFFLR